VKKAPWYHLFLPVLPAVLFLFPLAARAQQFDTVSIFKLPVLLDTVVVKSGFDVNAFIRRVRADTTFYKAFKSLHFIPYTSVNDFRVLDKKGGTEATYHSITRQIIVHHCRTTKTLQQSSTGNFFNRRGGYNYYTAELFAHLFFAKDTICHEHDIVAGSLDVQGKGQLAKSEHELKQLIFNPGAKVSGIPFMGDRAAIFEPGESKKYQFKITQERHDSTNCYVFRITPKKEYEKKVVYNELTTWFRKSDYSIIARDYSLSFSTLVYDFNVSMRVRTRQIAGKLYPTYISYDGDWHIFTRKRERVKFTVDIAY
jgi:hypothetical protein